MSKRIKQSIRLTPPSIIRALAVIKLAAATTNYSLGKLPAKKAQAIKAACKEVIAGKLAKHFPLKIWQSGSGTQTNMNCNEVIAIRATELANLKSPIHHNDDVNMSPSSNDVFSTGVNSPQRMGILLFNIFFPSSNMLTAAL